MKNTLLLIAILVTLGNKYAQAQVCQNDTIYSDVIFLIDDSGSIDSAEFVAFTNIILQTVNDLQAACPEANIGIVHYGGANGTQATVEYPLANNNVINSIDRQYCTSRDINGFCVGGGGDDLNSAIGFIMGELSGGQLDHNLDHNLSLVILTDAFGFDTSCGQPNCSLILPTTNIDNLKSAYNADVSVVGMSSQAEESLLSIYASPGGDYTGTLFPAYCTGSFDECTRPRKYVEVEFNSDPDSVSAIIADFVSCTIIINEGLAVDAGMSQMVCSDLSQIATLTAVATTGTKPYQYAWSNGATDSTTMVIPAMTTKYYVTATDANMCMAIDSVTVVGENCCTTFAVNAGQDTSVCVTLNESTTLNAIATGSGTSFMYTWNQGLGAGASHLVSPSVTTTYEVTATDNQGCTTTDQVTVTATTCTPSCDPDTTFTDVIFLIDNSGSIDDSEFATFENVIVESLSGLRQNCASSNRSVVHYGGVNGTSTTIEYSLGQVAQITDINRQFCTARDAGDLCIGGGGDDLNNAIGDIMTFLGNGMLNRDPDNELALVIFTDAFGFDTNCQQPNCSLILPTTNIDIMKANYGVDVSVVGVSSQAEEVLLGIYASPGGTFNSSLYQPECTGSFDGCQLPRKYVQIEFNTPPADVSAIITSFVECTVNVAPKLIVEAGDDVTICANLGEMATLTALVDSGMGVPPYIYTWSDGLGTMQSVQVMPHMTHTYYVTATDANLCSAVDSVTVNGIQCNDCIADAGNPQDFKDLCLENGQAFLTTEPNDGVVLPMGFEEVYILTNEDLVIIDYSVGFRNFIVTEEGLYRIHTLVAEVTNPASEDYLDLNIIIPNESDLFLIVNCIENHDICAAFDFAGRVHRVFGPEDMMCMTFENSINLCMDGIDNDGDGLIDCADEECKELINCVENTLLACNDLTDNDGDGLVDCFDPDCFGFTVCFERGDNCNDGIDNDGDGLVDCADNSCDGSAPCEENTPFTCKDGRDNDNDGLTDCQEADCQKFIVCAEYTIEACQDGKDNDFDGLVDCADRDCQELLGDDICNPTEDTIAKCSDGEDNDGDGLVDCADPDCRTAELDDLQENLHLAIETRNATCPDNNNGTIRFVGIANNPNFQYSIDGGENFISSPLFTGLDAGEYNIEIKSEIGCALSGSVDVRGQACIEICHNGIDDDSDGLVDCEDDQCNTTDPYAPQIVNIIGADCPDFNNGSFSIAGLPGGVLYSIDGLNYQSLPKFSMLQDETYTLTYKDQNGCYPGPQIIIPVSAKVCIPHEICDNGIDDDLDGLTDCLDVDDCPGMDSDGDGVCNIFDRCADFDDALIGTPCDDLNDCTSDDIYTSDCGCAGTLLDSDGDGICDAEDQCANLNDTLIGTACDDGNACTTGDIYTSDCNCVGTFTDTDGDGICDAEDQCEGLDDALIGTACDDGNACTINDVYNSSCDCLGQLQDSDGDGVCDADDLCPLIFGTFCPEICNNGIDDDSDGLIDCADVDDCLFNGLNIIDFKSSLSEGADAHVVNMSTTSQSNFGTSTFLISQEGEVTVGEPYHGHIFINYPIESIFDVNGIILDTASITLFSDPEADQVGNNASLIHLIAEPWDENTITYNNRPEYNPDFFLTINRSNAFDQITIDVKPLLEKVIEEDLPFYGFIIQPREKTPTRSMVFASSEHPDQARTPEVYVAYRANCLIDEICNNGIDDDGDGLTDCLDSECSNFETDIITTDKITITSPSCSYAKDGIIELLEIDGYQYSFEDTLYKNSITIENLEVGTYNIFVKNSIGCVSTKSISLNTTPYAGTEICDNGIDDDGDGRIDCVDDECGKEDQQLTYFGSARPKENSNHNMTVYHGTCKDKMGSAYVESRIPCSLYSIDDQPYQTEAFFDSLSEGRHDVHVIYPSGCEGGFTFWVVFEECIEECGDALDNDFDGSTDCLDSDCFTFPQDVVHIKMNSNVGLDTYVSGVLNEVQTSFGKTSELIFEAGISDQDTGYRNEKEIMLHFPLEDYLEAGSVEIESAVLSLYIIDDSGYTSNEKNQIVLYSFDQSIEENTTTEEGGKGWDLGSLSAAPLVVQNDKLDINVTGLVQHIINTNFNNNYDGIYLIQNPLNLNSKLTFASREHPNQLLTPELIIKLKSTAALDSIMIIEHASCGNGGSINLINPDSEWSYSLDDNTYSTESSFSNLNVGTYSLYIRNQVGCTISKQFEIQEIGCIEFCSNGIDDDGDGLVDCADDDCCGDSSCTDMTVDFDIINSSCTANTGGIVVSNPDPSVDYFIMSATNVYNITDDTIPAGAYVLYALGACDTTVIDFTIGNTETCLVDDCSKGYGEINFSDKRSLLSGGTDLSDLSVGAVVLYEGAIVDCNNLLCDLIIVIEDINGVTVEAEDTGINILHAYPSSNHYATFTIRAVEPGSATTANPMGTSTTISNFILSPRDVDSFRDRNYTEVVGITTGANAPDSTWLDEFTLLENVGFVGGDPVTGFDFFRMIPLDGAMDFSSNILSDPEDDENAIFLFYNAFTEVEILFGVTGDRDRPQERHSRFAGIKECLIVEYQVEESTCEGKTGQIIILNPSDEIEYFLEPSSPFSSGMFDSLTPGPYTLFAANACDTTALDVVVELQSNCNSIEICNNGIDDDGDGLVDCADDDCEVIDSTESIKILDACSSNNNGSIDLSDFPNKEDFTYALSRINLIDTLAAVEDAFTNPCIPDTMFGVRSYMTVSAWTYSGSGCNLGCVETKAYLNFNWDMIPVGTQINSATLSFVSSEPNPGRNCEAGPNTSLVKRITSSWSENEISHSGGLPSTTDLNSAAIGELCNEGDIGSTDVTVLIQNVLSNRDESFGLELSLENPTCYRGFNLGTHEGGQPALIYIEYTSSIEMVDSDSYKFEGLAPGEYELLISDGSGCTRRNEIEIKSDNCQQEICNNGIDDDGDGLVDCADDDCDTADPYNPSFALIMDASCPDLNNGSFTGSGLPFGVVRSIDGVNFQEDSTFSNLSPGVYYVQYKDELGCYGSDSIVIEVEPLIDLSQITTNASSCPDNNDGAIVIDTPDTTFEYSLDGTFFGSFPGFSNLDSGRYTLYVRSVEGCITSTELTIEGQSCTGAVSSAALNINVMLQGACAPDGGLMNTELNKGGYLPGQEPETFFGLSTPAGQPFNQAPWFYEGEEGLSMKSNNKSNEPIYDEEVVDWVLVSLRMDASKLSEVWRGAALLYNDGYVKLFNPVEMSRFSEDGYFVVIEHRNHLPVMSHDKVQVVNGMMTYDFLSHDSYSSIIGVGQIKDEFGRYMMVAGNGELIVEISSDIDINARDLTMWLQNNGANSSYFLEDYDMNGDINIKDRILWEKNNGLFTTLQTK